MRLELVERIAERGGSRLGGASLQEKRYGFIGCQAQVFKGLRLGLGGGKSASALGVEIGGEFFGQGQSLCPVCPVLSGSTFCASVDDEPVCVGEPLDGRKLESDVIEMGGLFLHPYKSHTG